MCILKNIEATLIIEYSLMSTYIRRVHCFAERNIIKN